MSRSNLDTLILEYNDMRIKARRYLLRGIRFLFICVIAKYIVEYLNLSFYSIVSEGIAIVGWVALWRPIEMFIYEIPELKQRINTQRKV